MAKKKVEKVVEQKTLDTIENWAVFGAKMAIVDIHTHIDDDKTFYQAAISLLLDDFSDDEDITENRKFISILLDTVHDDVNVAIYNSVKCAIAMFDNVANKVNVYDENHDSSKEYDVDKVFAKVEKAAKKKSKSGVSFY